MKAKIKPTMDKMLEGAFYLGVYEGARVLETRKLGKKAEVRTLKEVADERNAEADAKDHGISLEGE